MNEDNPIFREVEQILSATGFGAEFQDDAQALFENLLSDDETNILIISLNAFRNNTGFTNEELEQLVIWARMTRFHNTMLELVLQKKLLIDVVKDDDFHFRQPVPEELVWMEEVERKMKEMENQGDH